MERYTEKTRIKRTRLRNCVTSFEHRSPVTIPELEKRLRARDALNKSRSRCSGIAMRVRLQMADAVQRRVIQYRAAHRGRELRVLLRLSRHRLKPEVRLTAISTLIGAIRPYFSTSAFVQPLRDVSSRKRHVMASILLNSATLQSHVATPDVIAPTTAPRKAVLPEAPLSRRRPEAPHQAPSPLRCSQSQRQFTSVSPIPSVVIAKVPSGTRDSESQHSALQLVREALSPQVPHQLTPQGGPSHIDPMAHSDEVSNVVKSLALRT